MPDKKITETEAPAPTTTEVNNAPWQEAIAELKAQIEGFKKDLIDVKSDIRSTETRLHGRISVIDQKVSSPGSTASANKLPNIGDTINDAEVVHVSAGVPGGPGPSVVTRGKD